TLPFEARAPAWRSASQGIARAGLQRGNGSCYLPVTGRPASLGPGRAAAAGRHTMRVLVVEDHKELAATVAVGLRREGMAVDIVHDGKAALGHAGRVDYDVIVLDRDLPRLGGDEVCQALVARSSQARVLMLTAAATIENRVDG